jgi:hypothetical protein
VSTDIALSHSVCALLKTPFSQTKYGAILLNGACKATPSVSAIAWPIAGRPHAAADRLLDLSAVLYMGAIVIHEKYISPDIPDKAIVGNVFAPGA